MTKQIQLSNDLWLKEIVLNGNPNFADFYKEDLIKMINICKEEIQKCKEAIDKLSKIIYEIKELTEATGGYPSNYIDNLLDILKEAER